MKALFTMLVVSTMFAVAQDKPANSDRGHDNDHITIQGCVSRLNGDYVLMKQSPAVTYELQATRGVRLKHYLGQRVEVSGEKSPTMASSSDAMTKTGSASPETITVRRIKMVDKECRMRQ